MILALFCSSGQIFWKGIAPRPTRPHSCFFIPKVEDLYGTSQFRTLRTQDCLPCLSFPSNRKLPICPYCACIPLSPTTPRPCLPLHRPYTAYHLDIISGDWSFLENILSCFLKQSFSLNPFLSIYFYTLSTEIDEIMGHFSSNRAVQTGYILSLHTFQSK